MPPSRDEIPRFPPDSRLHRPDAHFLRGGFGRFATGVAVVTFDADDEDGMPHHHGITVNSFTSVSMDPPLVLVAIQCSVVSHDLIRGRPFAVNVLGAEHESLAMHFAGRPRTEPAWVTDPAHPAPRLAGALAWFACTPWAEYPGGDHSLHVGHVDAFDYRPGDALGFISGRFTTIHESFAGHESVL